jgi:formylglycine-generating enzyme required for sulfatase activity
MKPIHRHDGIGDFVELGPAKFGMGAAESDRYATTAAGPVRLIEIPYRFAIGVFPITCEQWEFNGDGTLPKVHVSWNDIQIWLDDACRRCALPLRLPSEAEWEYAARAGSTGGFPTGDSITPAEANFLHDAAKNRVGPGHLTPRGTSPPNAFGLEDMLGNVAEWTAGEWEGMRVVRSGGWDALPRLLRLSARYPLPPDRRQDNLGFRLAYTLT